MKTLSSDRLQAIQETPREKISADPKDISDLLKDYKGSMSVTVDTDKAIETESNTFEWVGNKDYFQTGPKAGQKKKHRGVRLAIQPTDETSEISGELITGALFLTLVDLLFPLIVASLNNWASKTKIKTEDLQLTEKQLRLLEPVGDKVVKQLMLSANPATVLFITMGGIYALNYAAIKLTPKKDD